MGSEKFTGSELNGKTLGILGMGRIGAEVSKRARAFQMNVLAYDPYLTEARAKDLGVTLADLDTLIESADYITVHMPLTAETKHMINAESIQRMKTGVRIFNCARGGIIEESALIEALKSGQVAAAGLDVYKVEPPPEDSELRKLPNLVLTPHLGASTQEAQENVGIDVARQMIETLRGNGHERIKYAIGRSASVREIVPLRSFGGEVGNFFSAVRSRGRENDHPLLR